jgi:hypothetical protein
MTAPKDGLSCPSAQPNMQDARIFGVIGGSAEEPRIAYLKESAVVDPSALEQLGPLEPTQVFRFAARCEESRCVHFNGSRCTLAERIVAKLAPVVDTLPPCLIRPTCRWYAERGAEACLRCPQVVTMVPSGDETLDQVARPDAPDSATA